MKSQKNSKVVRIQHLGNMNICTKSIQWLLSYFSLDQQKDTVHIVVQSSAALTVVFLSADSLCIQRFDTGLGLIAPMNPMMAGISLVPPPPVAPDMPVIKEIIHCKSCTLFPQNPSKIPHHPQPDSVLCVHCGACSESSSSSSK